MFGRTEPKKQSNVREYFTYKDSITGVYSEPMLAMNGQDLVRDITNMLSDPKQARNKLLLNAENYAIFKIGEFDDMTGTITVQVPEHVANIHDIRDVIQRNNAKKGPEALLPT